jgi:hypothetical protein
MKEEALKLADDLVNGKGNGTNVYASIMLRRLVEELDKQQRDGVSLNSMLHPHNKIDIPESFSADSIETIEVDFRLSDKEIIEVWKSITKNMLKDWHLDFARAIEAKVRGEK